MKWDKRRGGMVQGETIPQRNPKEYEKRWKDIMLDWGKKEPWKMFFSIKELVKRFNRGAAKSGFHRIQLIENHPTFRLKGFTYTLPT